MTAQLRDDRAWLWVKVTLTFDMNLILCTDYCLYLDDRVMFVEGASYGCQRRVPTKGVNEGCPGCMHVLLLSSTNRCWIHGVHIPIGATFRAYWRMSRACQVVWCGVGRGSHDADPEADRGGARQHTRFAMFHDADWCSAGRSALSTRFLVW